MVSRQYVFSSLPSLPLLLSSLLSLLPLRLPRTDHDYLPSHTVNDCGKWLNNVGNGQRYDGTYYTPGNTTAPTFAAVGDCAPWNVRRDSSLLPFFQ